jgi:SagB-type dehydrogenase family enzyme
MADDETNENENIRFEDWISVIQYKTYPRFDGTELPWIAPTSEIDQFALERQSRREPSNARLDAYVLSGILRFSAGRQREGEEARCYPSAGARYPLELYLLVYDVEGMEDGAYHYSVLDHQLTRLWNPPTRENLQAAWDAEEPDLRSARVVFFFSSLEERTTMKYGELGSHFPLIECGYLGFLILQQAHRHGLHYCPMGAQWNEEQFRAFFDLDEDERILHAIVIQ